MDGPATAAVLLFSRLEVGGALALSGAAKLLDVPSFVAAARAFGVIPPRIARGAALSIIGAELGCAAALLSGLATGAALPAAAILLASFTAILVRALGQGRRVPCRCFGPFSSRPASWATVARNVVLLATSLAGLGAWARASPAGSGAGGTTSAATRPLDGLAVALLSVGALALLALAGEAAATLGPAGRLDGVARPSPERGTRQVQVMGGR